MVDKSLFDKLINTHKNNINNDELFDFIFKNVKPLIVTKEQIILEIDEFSSKFLLPNSLNYNLFLQTCKEVIQIDNINLEFITSNAINNNESISLTEHLEYIESDIDNEINNDNINSNNYDYTSNTSLYLDDNKENNKFNYNDTNLSNNLNFKNFFYSYENKKIIDAAKLVIDNLENPTFNPFFIYGISGIGKTHILHAIGNEIYNTYNNKKILYLHAQIFIEEYSSLFTGGINNTNKIEEFKEKYNSIDVLLIDDIQHLEAKEASLNEFFGIFEKMRNNNKMVIIASDKHPQKIHFEERLITRFLSGLNCQMQIPDSNTKKEIFYYHAQNRDFIIDDDAVLIFINNSKNVRELIGYLNTITLYLISDDIPDMQITSKIANTIINRTSMNPKELTEDDIIKIIADYFNVKISDIRSNKRNKNIVTARHFCAYFLRKKCNQKYTQIAYNLGFTDHTAAINAKKAADKKINSQEYERDYNKLNKIIN